MDLSNRVYRMFHGYLRDFYDAIWRIQPTKWPIGPASAQETPQFLPQKWKSPPILDTNEQLMSQFMW